MVIYVTYIEHILPLYQKKAYLRTERNKYYSMYYYGNYSAQIRNNAREKYLEIEKKLQDIQEEINYLNEKKGQIINYEIRNL